MKSSSKATVFKRVSWFIRGAKHVDGGAGSPWPLAGSPWPPLGAGPDITYNYLYKEPEILKFKDIYRYHLEMAKFMFLYKSQKLPTIFNSYFTSVNTMHTHITRNVSRNNFYINSINSNIAKKHSHSVGRKSRIEYP